MSHPFFVAVQFVIQILASLVDSEFRYSEIEGFVLIP
jgi:hypothetical protein